MQPRRSAALAFALALVAAHAARAQHPLPPSTRPLHVRIAAADVVAVGTIGAIHDGRIEVRDAAVLRGDAAPSFEIKRSPAVPPPFVTGVPAVLFLRGARSPYVLVDEPREVVLPPDAATAKRWEDALRALFASEGDPQKLLHTYLMWLDGEIDTLRDAAGAALSDSTAAYLPLGRDDALARAKVALEPHRAATVRRVSAGLAVSHADGAVALVEGIPGEDGDPQVVALALRSTEAVAREARQAALLRSLASESADVRRAALMSATLLWNDAIAARVKVLAESDPDADVKIDAADAIARAVAGSSG
jgi:hypothetical protein